MLAKEHHFSAIPATSYSATNKPISITIIFCAASLVESCRRKFEG
jgi:hypothetical protein